MEDLTNLIGAIFNQEYLEIYDDIVYWGLLDLSNRNGMQAVNECYSNAETEEAAVKLRVNALIKRASLFIQQCKVRYFSWEYL